MADYLPTKENQRLAWLRHFATWLTQDNCANAIAHGITWDEACGYAATILQTTLAFIHDNETHAHARGVTARKNHAIGNAIAHARDLAQRIQHHPNTTDAQRGAAGLTIPDPTPTKTNADAIAQIPPPLLHLDFSIHHQVTIHWGPNPQDEHHNARPKGTIGVEIQYHQGGLPPHETDWRTLDRDTDSPYIHQTHNPTPTTYAYRARYITKKLKHGPPGEPALCTVSV